MGLYCYHQVIITNLEDNRRRRVSGTFDKASVKVIVVGGKSTTEWIFK